MASSRPFSPSSGHIGLRCIPGQFAYDSPGHNPQPAMPAPKLIIPTRQLNVCIPEDVMARLDLYLVAGTTGRVPKGAYQRFLVARITEFLEKIRQGLEVMPANMPAPFLEAIAHHTTHSSEDPE